MGSRCFRRRDVCAAPDLDLLGTLKTEPQQTWRDVLPWGLVVNQVHHDFIY